MDQISKIFYDVWIQIQIHWIRKVAIWIQIWISGIRIFELKSEYLRMSESIFSFKNKTILKQTINHLISLLKIISLKTEKSLRSNKF